MIMGGLSGPSLVNWICQQAERYDRRIAFQHHTTDRWDASKGNGLAIHGREKLVDAIPVWSPLRAVSH